MRLKASPRLPSHLMALTPSAHGARNHPGVPASGAARQQPARGYARPSRRGQPCAADSQSGPLRHHVLFAGRVDQDGRGQALEQVREWYAGSPRHVAANFEAADRFFEDGDVREAKAAYERIIGWFPSPPHRRVADPSRRLSAWVLPVYAPEIAAARLRGQGE